MKMCPNCGGKLVKITGPYPGTPKRYVCPTCLQYRLDQIQRLSSSHYGQAGAEQKEANGS